jgi:H+/gluconate symporter-like permease
MLGFGLWWLGRAEAAARRAGEQFGDGAPVGTEKIADDQMLRERATTAREFDPAEIRHGSHGTTAPPVGLAVLPLLVVVCVNLVMSLVLLPRLDLSYLSEERWGATSLSAVGGVWAVVTALAAAILTVVGVNRTRLPALRETMDAGANASVLPALSVASLVGFGAVVAAMPAFAVVRDWVLGIGLISIPIIPEHVFDHVYNDANVSLCSPTNGERRVSDVQKCILRNFAVRRCLCGLSGIGRAL